MLLELRVGQVRGFDLSSLDAYRWHPGTERIEIDRSVMRRCCAASGKHQHRIVETRVRELRCCLKFGSVVFYSWTSSLCVV